MRRLAILLAAPLALEAQAPLTAEQLINARRWDEAKVVVEGMLARNRNDPAALYLRGRIYYAQDSSSKAVDWFEKAVDRAKESAEYHLWLGRALGDEAQKASKFRQPFLARRVKSEFERAVALDPKMIDARMGLVDFYSMAPGVMGGSIDKAREQAAEIGKLNPIRGHFAAARVAERQKDHATAEREYKAAIAFAPDSSDAYYSLGASYRNQSRWDDAFAIYEELMKRRPDEMPVHLTWAGTAAQSGTNLERGEREAKLYIANAKDAPAANMSNAHWRLGQIYEQTGRKDLARAEFTEALKLNPSNQNAKKSLEALK